MTKGNILLVDDEVAALKYYVRALTNAGYNVRQIRTPDDALRLIKEEHSPVDIAILDIMLPPGNSYANKDTDEGLKTGLFLYSDVRDELPETPIVVLTNVGNEDTLEQLTEGPLLQIAQKLDNGPFDLVELVNNMLNSITRKFPIANGANTA